MFQLEFGSAFYGPGHFYNDIVGARRFERTGRGDVKGIVADDRTGRIVIHLVRPERSFSRKLAMTFTAPVPTGTPIRNQSFDPPPATGPYVITDSMRRGWTYERNPEWLSRDHRLMPRIPNGHLNTIKIHVVRNAVKATREVEHGRLDWLSEEMPAPTLASLRKRFPSRVRLEPILSTEYFWLNTSTAPFDDVRVRRAVNYAVDRDVFKRLSAGQMSPTQQILPPDLPGYKRFSPYPRDMTKARQLIAAAKPSVRDMTIWTYGESGDLQPIEFAVYLAAVLHELGFTVHLRVLKPGPYFSMIRNSKKANLDVGIDGYFANYPDPDDFFGGTLGAPVTPQYNEIPRIGLDVESPAKFIQKLGSRISNAFKNEPTMGPPNFSRIAEMAEAAAGVGSLGSRAKSCGKSALEGAYQVGAFAAYPDGGTEAAGLYVAARCAIAFFFP